MESDKVIEHIVAWLSDYAKSSGIKGFVIGISGGIDSAVTSTLCAKTGMNVFVVNMPILQPPSQFDRSNEHINWLKSNFDNVQSDHVAIERNDDEQAMLDEAWNVEDNSRLGCQIPITSSLDGLKVKLAPHVEEDAGEEW